MEANDYHVVVYQILAYLYNCLKDGIEPNMLSLEKFKDEYNINEKYWQYISASLYRSKFLDDRIADSWITPLGIGYLMESNNMRLARDFVRAKNLPVIAPLE